MKNTSTTKQCEQYLIQRHRWKTKRKSKQCDGWKAGMTQNAIKMLQTHKVKSIKVIWLEWYNNLAFGKYLLHGATNTQFTTQSIAFGRSLIGITRNLYWIFFSLFYTRLLFKYIPIKHISTIDFPYFPMHFNYLNRFVAEFTLDCNEKFKWRCSDSMLWVIFTNCFVVSFHSTYTQTWRKSNFALFR